MLGIITNNNEAAYREEVQALTSWSQNDDLLLNSKKTKKLVFRRHKVTTGSGS